MTNLLPGLRELRGPFGAGLASALAFWLGWGSAVPTRGEASGSVAALYSLSELLGRPAMIGIGLSVAYLFGMIIIQVSDWIFSSPVVSRVLSVTGASRRDLRHRKTRSYLVRQFALRIERSEEYSSALTAQLDDLISRVQEENLPPLRAPLAGKTGNMIVQRARGFGETASLAGDIIDLDWYAGEVDRELTKLPSKLIGREPELFSLWDRHRCEGDFRLALVLPLLACTVVLATRESPFWAVAAAVPAMLYYLGNSAIEKADGYLFDWLVSRRLESSVIDLVESGPPRLLPLDELVRPTSAT